MSFQGPFGNLISFNEFFPFYRNQTKNNIRMTTSSSSTDGFLIISVLNCQNCLAMTFPRRLSRQMMIFQTDFALSLSSSQCSIEQRRLMINNEQMWMCWIERSYLVNKKRKGQILFRLREQRR